MTRHQISCNSTAFSSPLSVVCCPLSIVSQKNEEYSYCGRICHAAGGVDKELSEAIAEDWGEHHPG